MKNFSYAFLIVLLSSSSGKTLSLLYSPEEEKEVLSYLQQQVQKEQQAEEHLTLSGLFYLSPARWCLWLNGEKCTPQDCNPRYRIEHVTAEGVTLRIDNRPDLVTIKPGALQDTSGNSSADPVD